MTGHKLPFLPFYLNDWESDEKVRLMGPATRYVYLHLLMHQWREGSIPADRKLLLRILQFPHDPQNICQGYAPIDSENTGMSEEVLSDHFDIGAALGQVLECFNSDGHGHLKNKRLEVLRLQHLGRKRDFSARGKAGRMKQLSASARAQAGESESDTESDTKIPPINTSPQGDLQTSREHIEMSKRQVAASRALVDQSAKVLAEGRFRKPSLEELTVYMESIGLNGTTPQAFLDHYESNGWRVGRTPMRDWRAAARTWKRNDYGGNGNGNGHSSDFQARFDRAMAQSVRKPLQAPLQRRGAARDSGLPEPVFRKPD